MCVCISLPLLRIAMFCYWLELVKTSTKAKSESRSIWRLDRSAAMLKSIESRAWFKLNSFGPHEFGDLCKLELATNSNVCVCVCVGTSFQVEVMELKHNRSSKDCYRACYRRNYDSAMGLKFEFGFRFGFEYHTTLTVFQHTNR